MTEKRPTKTTRKYPPRPKDRNPALDLLSGAEEIKADTRETIFAVEYITNGFNASKAYAKIYPGYKPDSHKFGSQPHTWYLRRPVVQELISHYMSLYLREKANELQHKVVDTLFAQAFYDPAMFMNTDGSPRFRDWDEIPENLRCCVKRIDTRFYGKEGIAHSTIVLEDRDTALMALSKYVAMVQAGPGAGTSSRADAVSAETELLLSSVLNGARSASFAPQPDAKLPAGSRGIVSNEETPEKVQEPFVVSISGLG